MFVNRNVGSRRAYRTLSSFFMFYSFILEANGYGPWNYYSNRISFLLSCIGQRYFDREIKEEYPTLRYLKMAKLERTVENRKIRAFWCTDSRSSFVFFCFLFFCKAWSYCLYPAYCDDNLNIGVPYFTKGRSVRVY